VEFADNPLHVGSFSGKTGISLTVVQIDVTFRRLCIMAEQLSQPPMGPRDYINAEFISRAWRDQDFRAALLKDPRAVVEQELGVRLPEQIQIQIHQETPDTLHFILPPPPAALKDAVIGPFDLADREVAGYADKDYGTGYSDCHACASGVRG
jgi:hypothetical protein